MVQETATPTDVIETPASTRDVTAGAIPSDASVPAEGATPEIPGELPDEDPSAGWLAEIDAEDFPHKEALARRLDSAGEKGWKAAEEYLQPQIQQVQQTERQRVEAYTEATAAFSTLSGRLRTMQEQGLISDDAIANNPKVWASLQSIGEEAQSRAANAGYTQGRFYEAQAAGMAVYGDLLKEAGKPSAMAKLTPLFQNAKNSGDLQAAHKAAMTAVKAAFASQLIPLGRKGGAEEEKVKQRTGQRPAQGVGAAAGKSGDFTYDQILKMSKGQIDALPAGALQTAIDKASK